MSHKLCKHHCCLCIGTQNAPTSVITIKSPFLTAMAKTDATSTAGIIRIYFASRCRRRAITTMSCWRRRMSTCFPNHLTQWFINRHTYGKYVCFASPASYQHGMVKKSSRYATHRLRFHTGSALVSRLVSFFFDLPASDHTALCDSFLSSKHKSVVSF